MQIALRDPNVQWSDVMKAVDATAPRVGPLVIEQGDLLEAVRKLCPEHTVRHVVVCRGTDRMLGPNTQVVPGEAPLRKMICIRRRFEDISEEPQWERWEQLSNRQLRRNCTAARCNLTVVARPRYESWPESHDSAAEPSVPVLPAPAKRAGDSTMNNEDRTKRFKVQDNQSLVKIEQPSVDREAIDLISQKHGPAFVALPSTDQQWLIKLHKNLGHPGLQKMQYVCQQLGCSPEIQKALVDLRCSTCLESKGPEIPRPGSIKEPMDFGDVVAMDGVTWTNSAGTTFHFYHMIDQSTSFQTAVCAPSRTAEAALKALTTGWILRAGPPSKLVLDAAGEFCDDAIQGFAQKHGICLKIIPPEAHWQNGRCERHGGILQEMLTKMDIEESIDSYAKLEQSLAFATQTKNQWSRHRGYPPELLVFGKLQRQPGSTISDLSTASHELARSECPDGIRFRAELAKREAARQAFVKVDNDQACRRALLQRSRPNRGRYQYGDWIMMWRDNKRWIGPMKVIQQDGDECVWAVFGSKMYRAAPEQVRPLTAVEELGQQSNPMENLKGPPEVEPQGQQVKVIQDGSFPASSPPVESPAPEIVSSHRDSTEPEPSIGSPSIVNTEDLNVERQDEGPAGIPIPDDTDDDLVCETLHVSSDQCWSMEIELSLPQVMEMYKADEQEHVTLLTTAAKKQRSEVRLKDLTSTDRKLFEQAKNKELQSWLDTGTIQRIFRGQIPKENILRCRWLLTWKEVEEQNQSARVPKARLIVLGYEDPQLCNLDRDSPTLTKLARMLLLQFCSSSCWSIGSFDIKTAFLRGSDDQRQLGLDPPEEMRIKMGLQDSEIVQLLKGAYGRADAPLLWFRELQKGLQSLGFTQSPFDPCLFIYEKAGKVCGLVGVHVDDGLYCGTPEFHEQIRKLEAIYPFGSRKTGDFVFTGLHIKQHQDYSITVDQTRYVKEIEPIHISAKRRQEHEAPVTETERQHWQLGDKALLKLPPAFTALKDDDGNGEPNESMIHANALCKKINLSESILSTDCKSLYDIISRTAPPSCTEFRTVLQAKLIREHLATGVMIRWVPTGAQMADSLTKIMDGTVLSECLRLGRYHLQDEAQVLKTRADAKTRLRWLRGTKSNSESEKSQEVSEHQA
eukprot:s532_g18.t1